MSDLGICAIVLQEENGKKMPVHTLAGNSNKGKDHMRSLKRNA